MTGKIARKNLLRVAAGLLIGAASLTLSPAAWGQQADTPRVDRSLPGARAGVMTETRGNTLRIDGYSYELSPSALIESAKGKMLDSRALARLSGIDTEVQYWTGPSVRQITQIVVTLPE